MLMLGALMLGASSAFAADYRVSVPSLPCGDASSALGSAIEVRLMARLAKAPLPNLLVLARDGGEGTLELWLLGPGVSLERRVPLAPEDCRALPDSLPPVIESWIEAVRPSWPESKAAPLDGPYFGDEPARRPTLLTLHGAGGASFALEGLAPTGAVGLEAHLLSRYGVALMGRYEGAFGTSAPPGRIDAELFTATLAATSTFAPAELLLVDLLAGPELEWAHVFSSGFLDSTGRTVTRFGLFTAGRARMPLSDDLALSATLSLALRPGSRSFRMLQSPNELTLGAARAAFNLGFSWNLPWGR